MCIAPMGSYAREELATPVVERLQAALLDVMKHAGDLGYSGRYTKLEPVIRATHDFDYIVRAMLGQSVKQLSDPQFKEVVDAFAEMGISTYAREFDSYSGESFWVVDEKPATRGNRLVHSVMRAPSGGTVRFDYVLRQSGDEWRIVNTIADGVSQLAVDRSQAQAVLREQGYEGLIRWIRGNTRSS
jgi:phospholipid transport system substrate-binding protein